MVTPRVIVVDGINVVCRWHMALQTSVTLSTTAESASDSRIDRRVTHPDLLRRPRDVTRRRSASLFTRAPPRIFGVRLPRQKTQDYLPTARGFDSWYGYYSSFTSYFSHVGDLGACQDTQCYTDFNLDGAPLPLEEGIYSTSLFSARATSLIGEHDTDGAFFRSRVLPVWPPAPGGGGGFAPRLLSTMR